MGQIEEVIMYKKRVNKSVLYTSSNYDGEEKVVRGKSLKVGEKLRV